VPASSAGVVDDTAATSVEPGGSDGVDAGVVAGVDEEGWAVSSVGDPVVGAERGLSDDDDGVASSVSTAAGISSLLQPWSGVDAHPPITTTPVHSQARRRRRVGSWLTPESWHRAQHRSHRRPDS
jgi:hypothetical protein